MPKDPSPKTWSISGSAIRAINEADHTVETIVSDDTVDRHESIIAITAWEQDLASYLNNPVLCWGHPLNQWDAVGPEDLIGRSISTTVGESGLSCKFQYAVNENERAALVWRLVSAGYLRMYSVGARLLDWVNIWSDTEEIMALPAKYREAMVTGQCYEVITRAELLEVSQVFVGSNRNAIAKAYKSGLINRKAVDLLLPANRIPDDSRSFSLPSRGNTPPMFDYAELSRHFEKLRELSTDISPPPPPVEDPTEDPADPVESVDEDQELENLLQDQEVADAVAEAIEAVLIEYLQEN